MIESPPLSDVLAFCTGDPVERVFLEDVARRGLGRFVGLRGDGGLRALCHVGANLVPSGRGVAGLARQTARSSPRMAR